MAMINEDVCTAGLICRAEDESSGKVSLINTLQINKKNGFEIHYWNSNQGFWPIWRTFRKKVFNYCLYKLSTSYDEAEDLCSVTMLKAWEKFSELKPASNILAWLIQICRNSYLDGLRKKNIEKKYADDLVVDDAVEDINNLIVSEYHRTLLNYLKQKIANLPEKLAHIAHEYFFLEKNYQQMSQELQCSEAYLRKQIFIIRNVIRAGCCSDILVVE